MRSLGLRSTSLAALVTLVVCVACATKRGASVPTSPEVAAVTTESWPIGHVRYNVVFSETLEGTQAVLDDGREVTARFYLGPPDQRSAVAPDDAGVSATILDSRVDVPLTVTLSCSFCAATQLQKRSIVYHPHAERSTDALFSLLPQRQLTDGQGGVGKLSFQVTSDGVHLDTVVVTVHIGTAPAAALLAAVPVTFGDLTVPDWARPIDLTLTCKRDGDRLVVQLEGGSPAVNVLLNGRERDTSGQLRSFRTGLTYAEIPEMLGRYYLDLYAVVSRNDALRRSLSGDPTAAVPEGGGVSLTADDERALLQMFHSAGAGLYRRLFVEGADEMLRQLMVEFDAYSTPARPVRVRIETDGLYIPWQMLRVSGPFAGSKAEDFWGFKYELSVNPVNRGVPGAYPGPMEYRAGPLVFAKYRGDAPNDLVTGFGDYQIRCSSRTSSRSIPEAA